MAAALIVLGALAIAAKHDVVFFVWTIYVYVRGLGGAIWLAAAGALAALTLIPYLPDGTAGAIRKIGEYGLVHPTDKIYGLALFMSERTNKLLFYVALALLPFVARYWLRLPLLKALALTALMFTICAYGWYEHYYIFVLLWCAFEPGLWLAVVSVLAIPTTSYLGLGTLPRSAIMAAIWLLCVGKLGVIVWQSRFRRITR